MDPRIEALIRACPGAIRGRTGDLTREEREEFDLIDGDNLYNQVSRTNPIFMVEIEWITPQTGEVVYQCPRRKSMGLAQLGYRLEEINGRRSWVLNRPEVVRAHKLSAYC